MVDSHHVHHGCRLIGLRQINHVEVVNMVMLNVVDEKVVDSVLICGSYNHQPKGLGPQPVLHRGFIIDQAQVGSWKWLASHRTPF